MSGIGGKSKNEMKKICCKIKDIFSSEAAPPLTPEEFERARNLKGPIQDPRPVVLDWEIGPPEDRAMLTPMPAYVSSCITCLQMWNDNLKFVWYKKLIIYATLAKQIFSLS